MGDLTRDPFAGPRPAGAARLRAAGGRAARLLQARHPRAAPPVERDPRRPHRGAGAGRGRLGVRHPARALQTEMPLSVMLVMIAYPSMSIFMVVVTLRIVFNPEQERVPAFWFLLAGMTLHVRRRRRLPVRRPRPGRPARSAGRPALRPRVSWPPGRPRCTRRCVRLTEAGRERRLTACSVPHRRRRRRPAHPGRC